MFRRILPCFIEYCHVSSHTAMFRRILPHFIAYCHVSSHNAVFLRILHHPQVEHLLLVHKYLHIEMLHLLCSIICIICGFYNVIYNY